MCEPLISVVIPVYNAAPYLPKCINSLLQQTYQNLEIILIDDGGTDHSPMLCDQYSQEDERIISIHISNSGVSAARNVGIAHCHGDYLMFLDADDWIEPETCRMALASALEFRADVVFWPFCCEYTDDGKNSVPKPLFLSEDHYFDEKETRDLYRLYVGPFGPYLKKPYLQDRLSPVWGKLYRAPLIKEYGLRFVDISKIGSEDTLFNIEVFSNVHRAVYLNHYWHHYRKSSGGTLTAAYKPGLTDCFFRLFEHIRAHLKENNESAVFYTALNNRIVLSLIGLGQNEVRNHTELKRSIAAIRSIITNSVYREAMADFPVHELPLWSRIFFCLAKMKAATALFAVFKLTQLIREKIHR